MRISAAIGFAFFFSSCTSEAGIAAVPDSTQVPIILNQPWGQSAFVGGAQTMQGATIAGARLAQAGPAPSDDPPLENGDSFDQDQYPAGRLKDILAKNPCKKGAGYELKDVPFSEEMVYRETLRDTPAEDAELVRRWAASLKAEDQAATFAREILIADGGETWWMPAPERLASYMREEFRAGDHPTLFMSLVGCVDGRPLVAIEEYSAPYYEDLEEGAASYVT